MFYETHEDYMFAIAQEAGVDTIPWFLSEIWIENWVWRKCRIGKITMKLKPW